jgi:hypothetical protein
MKEIRHTPIRAVAKGPPGSEGSRLTARMYARRVHFCINHFSVLNTGQYLGQVCSSAMGGWDLREGKQREVVCRLDGGSRRLARR